METDILKRIAKERPGILCFIVVILALVLPSKAGAGDVIDTISVGDGPYGVAVTPDGSYVYVTNSYDDTVSVIQTSDDSVVLNKSKTLALKGGWDSTFTTQTSYTAIKSMRISDGTVRTESLVIR